MVVGEGALPLSYIGNPSEVSSDCTIQGVEVFQAVPEQPADSQPLPVSQPSESLVMKTIKAGVIVSEILPIDDAIRYGLTFASQTQVQNPAVGAAVLGVSTLLVESSAVLASSKWIAEDRIRPVIDKTREKIDSFKEMLNKLIPRVKIGRLVPNIPKDPETSDSLPVTAQAAIALNLGTVVLLEAMQRRNTNRTAEQNRAHGLRAAALVSGYMAVEGALLTTGFNNITDPKYVLPAAVGLAGLHYGVHKLRQLKKRGQET